MTEYHLTITIHGADLVSPTVDRLAEALEATHTITRRQAVGPDYEVRFSPRPSRASVAGNPLSGTWCDACMTEARSRIISRTTSPRHMDRCVLCNTPSTGMLCDECKREDRDWEIWDGMSDGNL